MILTSIIRKTLADPLCPVGHLPLYGEKEVTDIKGID